MTSGLFWQDGYPPDISVPVISFDLAEGKRTIQTPD
jgi:hypothetical protein